MLTLKQTRRLVLVATTSVTGNFGPEPTKKSVKRIVEDPNNTTRQDHLDVDGLRLVAFTEADSNAAESIKDQVWDKVNEQAKDKWEALFDHEAFPGINPPNPYTADTTVSEMAMVVHMVFEEAR